jgi:glucose-1-phosphate adenylyltransferase
MIMAGGKGERLHPLTRDRSKPAVPFAGRYRIVDFVLSNFVNSDLLSLYILVQYKSQSLIEHVRLSWRTTGIVPDYFVTVVPPQMRFGPAWFRGTADAVLQNLNVIDDFNPDIVAIFGADHIYRMDINQMLTFHQESGADVTVAARPVPRGDATAFGVLAVDRHGKVVSFVEKPKQPPAMPNDPDRALVSMGNYLFTRQALVGTGVRLRLPDQRGPRREAVRRARLLARRGDDQRLLGRPHGFARRVAALRPRQPVLAHPDRSASRTARPLHRRRRRQRSHR